MTGYLRFIACYSLMAPLLNHKTHAASRKESLVILIPVIVIRFQRGMQPLTSLPDLQLHKLPSLS